MAEGAASETFDDDDGGFLFQSCEGDAMSQPDRPVYCAPRVDMATNWMRSAAAWASGPIC